MNLSLLVQSLLIGVLACSFSQLGAQSLDQLILQSLQTHPAVRSQQQQLQAAATEVEVARQQFFPVPSVSVERVSPAAQDPGFTGESTVTLFRLQQPLWTGGRLTAGMDKARANEAALQASLDDARMQLSLRVLAAWGDWYTARLRIKAHEASFLTHQLLLSRVQRRIQEGASAVSELTMTQGRLAQTQAAMEATLTQQQAARARLNSLVGQPLPVNAQPKEQLHWPEDDVKQLQALALQASPTMQKMKHQRAAVSADIAEKKSNLYPELSLRVEHQRGNYLYSNVPSLNRVFLSLNSKLGAGTSSLDQIRASEQRKQSLESDIQAQQLAIEEQVESEWLQLRSANLRKPSLLTSLEAARGTSESWERQFLAGRKTWQEVLNAARELLQAEVEMSEVMVVQSVIKWRLMLLSRGVDITLQKASSGSKP